MPMQGEVAHMKEKSQDYWVNEMLLSKNREDALENAIKAFPKAKKEDLENMVNGAFDVAEGRTSN